MLAVNSVIKVTILSEKKMSGVQNLAFDQNEEENKVRFKSLTQSEIEQTKR